MGMREFAWSPCLESLMPRSLSCFETLLKLFKFKLLKDVSKFKMFRFLKMINKDDGFPFYLPFLFFYVGL